VIEYETEGRAVTQPILSTAETTGAVQQLASEQAAALATVAAH
jgi:hypothetical protein